MSATQYIAVAVDDDGGLDAVVSQHFGHCVGFVVVEVRDGEIASSRMETNPFAQAHQPGALPKVIRGLGVHVLLAGGMGVKAQAMLANFGVDVATGAQGRVRDAVQGYLQGQVRGFTPCAEQGHHDGCGGHHHPRS